MSEQPYPIQCQSCAKPQYGPVKHCPYCGFLTPIVLVLKAVDEPKETEQVTEESAPIATSPEIVSQVPISKTAPALDPKPDPKPKQFPPTAVETAYEKPEDKQQIVSDVGLSETTLKAPKTAKDVLTSPPKTEPKPGKLKWIAVALVLVIIVVGTLVFHGKGKDGPQGPGKEAARILALDALRQGTDLSVTISKLPKLEKVLQAALDLQAISPRYQDQVTVAKNTISSARKARDKGLMAYLGKVLELGRYTPDQVSYAIGIIKNGDPTPREKVVVELLAGHIKALRNSTKPDSAKMLSSFTQRFNNFVD